MTTRLVSFLLLALPGALVGCSAESYRRRADEQSYGIIAEKQRAAIGREEPFSIDPAATTLRSASLGPRPDPVPPGPRAPAAAEPLQLDLARALSIAAENSRDFQAQKETVYRAALALTGGRYEFESKYFGTVSGDETVTGESGSTVSTATQSSSFGFTRLLKTGGSIGLAIGNNLSRVFTGTNGTSLTSSVFLTLSLPLLRNAGRAVAEEGLRQAERNALYAVREFEQFKKRFVVQIVSAYLELLRSLDEVANEESNLENLRLTRERNEALGRAGRLSSIEVDQARQNELRARERAIAARSRLEGRLDRFLESIGLPPDLPAEVSRGDLESLARPTAEPFSLAEARALSIAFRNRLDFANDEAAVADAARKVIVARSALRPGLDFVARLGDTSDDRQPGDLSLKEGEHTAGLDLDLPFNRRTARNAYRAAEIDLEAARREAARQEDEVKIAVRARLRELEQTRQTYEIQKNATTLATRRVESARDFLEAGRANTRDLLEAQDSLVAAQNAFTAALVDYEVSRLSLFRDLGVLQVSAGGLDYEATDALLREE